MTAHRSNIEYPLERTVGNASIFPVLKHRIHFDHAAVAPLPAPTVQEMTRCLDDWMTTGPKPWAYQRIADMRRLGAQIIGAEPDDNTLCYIPNTSTGLAIVARGLRLGKGDVIVTTAIEFPANRYVWDDLVQDGVKVKIVEPRDGFRLDDNDIIAALREHFPRDGTGLLAISHVQYATGQRHDIEKLAHIAHECGGLICVDAIQSVGQMPVEVERWGIDFLAADGHKWMLGPEGAGIFYCRAEHAELLRPPIVGWMNVRDAMNFSTHDFALRPDARRFESGCFNLAGAVGLARSLELLLEMGVDKIEQKIAQLTRTLREGVQRAGYVIVSPSKYEKGSGIVVFQPPQSGPSAASVVEELSRQEIKAATRRGVVRLSPHFYNTSEQIEKVLQTLTDIASNPLR